MKQVFLLLSAILLSGFSVNADTNTAIDNGVINNSYVKGYGNSFIFTEAGIEFSVYADGQFDFYMPSYGPQVSVEINNRNTNISFNTGYDYGAYVQYDEFGAVIQIENTPIYYDYYGRVNQVGNVYINYNNRGYISRVGGLYVHYNRYNRYSHSTGFINIYNRAYVYRPWHAYYVIPPVNYCVLYTTPYRRHYTPIRYRYDRPYVNNYRRTTAVASRRGNTISRNRALASRTEGRAPRATTTPRTRSNRATSATPRTRGNATTTKPRRSTTVNSTPRTRGNTVKTKTRNNNVITSKPRTRGNTTTKPRTRGNQTTTSNPRTRSNTKVNTRSNRSNTQVNKRTTSKPRTTTSRSTSSRQNSASSRRSTRSRN